MLIVTPEQRAIPEREREEREGKEAEKAEETSESSTVFSGMCLTMSLQNII